VAHAPGGPRGGVVGMPKRRETTPAGVAKHRGRLSRPEHESSPVQPSPAQPRAEQSSPVQPMGVSPLAGPVCGQAQGAASKRAKAMQTAFKHVSASGTKLSLGAAAGPQVLSGLVVGPRVSKAQGQQKGVARARAAGQLPWQPPFSQASTRRGALSFKSVRSSKRPREGWLVWYFAVWRGRA
jgi:hypothetical protein